jgi:hypothetical protein
MKNEAKERVRGWLGVDPLPLPNGAVDTLDRQANLRRHFGLGLPHKILFGGFLTADMMLAGYKLSRVEGSAQNIATNLLPVLGSMMATTYLLKREKKRCGS